MNIDNALKQYSDKGDVGYNMKMHRLACSIQERYFSEIEYRGGIFTRAVAYFVISEIRFAEEFGGKRLDFQLDPHQVRVLETAKLSFRARGGVALNCISQDTTHIILAHNDIKAAREVLKGFQGGSRPHAVQVDWIFKSASSQTWLPEGEFEVRALVSSC